MIYERSNKCPISVAPTTGLKSDIFHHCIMLKTEKYKVVRVVGSEDGAPYGVEGDGEPVVLMPH